MQENCLYSGNLPDWPGRKYRQKQQQQQQKEQTGSRGDAMGTGEFWEGESPFLPVLHRLLKNWM